MHSNAYIQNVEKWLKNLFTGQQWRNRQRTDLRTWGEGRRGKDDGTLVGEFSITAEGQSDAAVRGVFYGRYSDWDNAVRAELIKVADI